MSTHPVYLDRAIWDLDAEVQLCFPDPRLIEAQRVLRECDEPRIFIYAIQAGENGPIKIGKTVRVADRIATLQQANAEELIGLAAWWGFEFEEKIIHEDYAHARIRGEWFHPVDELVDYVLRMGREFDGDVCTSHRASDVGSGDDDDEGWRP